MAKHKVVISGSKGFVGSSILQRIDRNVYDIQEIDVAMGIDMTDRQVISKVGQFDSFIHLANLTYVPASYKDPEAFYRINYISTLNALELCRKYNAHLIYPSSYVYGKPKYLPVDEIHDISPFNPYAQSKVICEQLCNGYRRDFGISVSVLRPFNIYGKGQNNSFLIPLLNYSFHLLKM